MFFNKIDQNSSKIKLKLQYNKRTICIEYSENNEKPNKIEIERHQIENYYF